jgi:type I restriction enzyme S subunit
VSKWTTLPLRERVINHDKRRIPVRSSERESGVYPYYGASGVVDHVSGFLFDGTYLLVAEDGENLRSRKTPIAFLAHGQFWVNNHAHVIEGNADNDTRYLSYALEAADVGGFITGSAQPKLNQDALGRIPINAPGLAEQRQIAATLGVLDDKIASNRRAISLLRSLLDGMSASLRPSLPSTNLREIASVPRSTAKPSELGSRLVDHFSLPAFDTHGLPDRVPATGIMSNKFLVATASVLVSRLNPRINRTWFAVPESGYPALASTEFMILEPRDEIDLGALWLAVRDESFVSELVSRVTGTSGSHQRIRPDDALSITVPDVRQLDPSQKKKASVLLRLTHQREKESQRLARLRDALRPELLSGRLGVPERLQEVMETAS